MQETVFTSAVVQAAPALFDTPRTLARVGELAREAACRDARLVVFPEAFVGGYPKGLDFGARLGSRTIEGREDFRRYHAGAIDLPGPEAAMLQQIARDNGIFLVIGVIEREGGTLYCTALTIDPAGRIISRHRKLMPTALERLVWGFGDGSTIAAAKTSIGCIGSVICWENYMPLLRAAMYAQGVELYCAPTVDDRDTWLPTMQTIALEGRCFVLSACQYFTRADGPADYMPVQGDDPSTVLIRGGSCIIDPLGTVLIQPDFSGESIRYAEIDRRVIVQGKFDLDVVGHYGRPDIFQLRVDTQAKPLACFNAPFPAHDAGAPVAASGEGAAARALSD